MSSMAGGRCFLRFWLDLIVHVKKKDSFYIEIQKVGQWKLKNGKLKSWEAESSEVNQKTEVIILKKREYQTGQISTLILKTFETVQIKTYFWDPISKFLKTFYFVSYLFLLFLGLSN